MSRQILKNAIRTLIPLALRKRLSIWINKQRWIDSGRRSWWSTELISDFGLRDVNEYHKFCWAHHLGYAAPYEADSRFGDDAIRPSRRIFFSEMTQCLEHLGQSAGQVQSVFEVGCSLGYQLRHLETDLFPQARVLEGVDIDEYAIRSGQEHLASLGSKVVLKCGDMQQLETMLGGRIFDIIVCSGVLMYLKEAEAAAVVRTMLSHSRIMVAMAGLAHPVHDNSELRQSDVRERDRTLIHNLDAMVDRANGRILARRWDGDTQIEGQTLYFVFAGTA